MELVSLTLTLEMKCFGSPQVWAPSITEMFTCYHDQSMCFLLSLPPLTRLWGARGHVLFIFDL